MTQTVNEPNSQYVKRSVSQATASITKHNPTEAKYFLSAHWDRRKDGEILNLILSPLNGLAIRQIQFAKQILLNLIDSIETDHQRSSRSKCFWPLLNAFVASIDLIWCFRNDSKIVLRMPDSFRFIRIAYILIHW